MADLAHPYELVTDEGWQAVRKECNDLSRLLNYPQSLASNRMDAALAAALTAAPFVASAARVQVLREMAEEFSSAAESSRLIAQQQPPDDYLARRHVTSTAMAYERVVELLLERAIDIERGQ